VNWVPDADIREFFTRLDHRWLVKFLEHRIADKRVLAHRSARCRRRTVAPGPTEAVVLKGSLFKRP